ncbi:MRPL24 [Auxenochlorella protothecoides x Auxenochlorella symbiontica]
MGRYRRAFKPMFESNTWKIVKGDKVQITAGRDKGRIGTVKEVLRDRQWPRVVVEGANMVKRHIKATKETPAGSLSLEGPIHYSNVALVDPQTHAPVRVRWRYTDQGERVRQLCGGLASGSILPKPGYTRSRPRLPSNSPLDTPSAAAQEATHRPGDLPSFFDKILPAEAVGRRGIQLGRNTSRGWRGGGFAASALGA